MPFGLGYGPEVFHRALQHVLQKIDKWCCVFIDDILIWGSSKEEHDKRLRQVMEPLRVCNVRLQPEKCKFRQSSIAYYGHTLSQKRVAVSIQGRDQGPVGLGRVCGEISTSTFAEISPFATVVKR